MCTESTRSEVVSVLDCYIISCLNFWDEACWFLSLSIFELLPSSLLLFPRRFGRYVLWPSSGVCRTREPSFSIILSELELQSCYYVDFWTNTRGKGMNSLFPTQWVKKYYCYFSTSIGSTLTNPRRLICR